MPAVTSDYLPTILDLLEIEFPDQRPLDGISLLPLLTGKPMQVRDSPIGFQYRNSQSWVTQQFKLITTDKGKSWELYDLIADPGEQRDVSASHGELVKEMFSDLQKWVASCKKSDEEEDY
ncbi:sulfatase/phosphatase domain-containing protein [Thalassoglobus polymorphus]|uniref:sulfatase/phosphatase domain-containing protein n=1 Tax=Thalassoglobus polymorphus TaxID=2527994 RepID=UPI0018D269C6|nr:sulfatase/phosphatase domain-containing protein [Thalassoglobus polymorphus]